MLVTTNHWNSTDNNDETSTLIQLNNDYSNYSDYSQETEPVWICLSLISGK
jgi:hypothetical protein